MIKHGTPEFDAALMRFEPRVRDVIALAARLCAEPGVTVPHEEANFAAVERTCTLAADDARARGLCVIELGTSEEASYPALVITLPEHDPRERQGDVLLLLGHLDVVPPSHDGQFTPALDGDDLHARGAADMKVVAATWIAWMGSLAARRGPRPPVVLILSGCEENGSAAPHHAESAMRMLQEMGQNIRFAIVGERTGELEWMPQDIRVGPICKENRAWRWVRAEARKGGLASLHAMADAVRFGRQTIHALNEHAIDPGKKSRQPGVRSGFVCSFALAGGDARIAEDATWIRLERAPGESMHAAAASAAQPTLLETFADVATWAAARPGRTWLGGLAIGQDGNFNSWDGSGTAWLASTETWDPEELSTRWGHLITATPCAPEPRQGPACLGLDIREVMDHREQADELMTQLAERLRAFELTPSNARPPWRCPAAHPDLVALETAYAEIVGAPSPDLVKLHGNDGGALAAMLAEHDPAAGARAPVVVFGQVGMRPHGPREFHRCTSIETYWRIMDRWAELVS